MVAQTCRVRGQNLARTQHLFAAPSLGLPAAFHGISSDVLYAFHGSYSDVRLNRFSDDRDVRGGLSDAGRSGRYLVDGLDVATPARRRMVSDRTLRWNQWAT